MKQYKVNIGGVEHTFQYSDEDAKRLGLKADAEPKAAEEPANKARKATANKKG